MSSATPWRVRWDTRLRYMRASGTLRRITIYAVGGLIVVGLLWIVATAILARREGQRIQNELHQIEALVTQGRLDDAKRVAADIPGRAAHAHALTSGPAWWLGSHIPYLGRPLEIARGTTQAANLIGSKGVPDLLQVASSLDPRKLRTTGKSVSLQPLIAAAPNLGRAANALDQAVRSVDRLPSSSWLGAVNGPRINLAHELRAIGGYVDAAARASDILPDMLGQYGPQRYFIALQNEAEMRGTGGLPGAFAIVVANKGTLTFTHFESDAVMLPPGKYHPLPTGLNLGASYMDAYKFADPTSHYLNGNVSPNFPYAGKIWATMWEKVSGEHVDGAIALDPQVLADFLSVIGPVELPDHAVVNAQNVVTLTERDEYAIFSNNNERKQFVVSVLKTVSTALTTRRGDSTALARKISAAASQQRLMAWSADPRIEKVIAHTNYAGMLPDNKQAFSGVVLNNESAGKLDFYLIRKVSYHRSGCGSIRDVIATVTLTNRAPASGLPLYVTTRLDQPPPGAQPGDNRTLLDYIATPGSQLLSVSLNGNLTTAGAKEDLGHPIYRVDVELPRGKTQTIVFHIQEPATKGPVQIWRQPGVTPIGVTVQAQSCG